MEHHNIVWEGLQRCPYLENSMLFVLVTYDGPLYWNCSLNFGFYI